MAYLKTIFNKNSGFMGAVGTTVEGDSFCVLKWGLLLVLSPWWYYCCIVFDC